MGQSWRRLTWPFYCTILIFNEWNAQCALEDLCKENFDFYRLDYLFAGFAYHFCAILIQRLAVIAKSVQLIK